ncbi:hypothetical protein QBC33DRAFT_553546 [Phialemonium atrogriseum]|uniref:Uncharacterized protein n=1 Tax=Phialemonium atrogriseum TaxID=1093897 RepID=A0AAJ0BP54_9PEZI|nr:uncharacterized protein QBC33DRAFT_553546 [Phialemonium atrogriseum]KAK1761605.1 hypothetical protein QBC33DRAFT_553546 [Phialemonium atrogriseum]
MTDVSRYFLQKLSQAEKKSHASGSVSTGSVPAGNVAPSNKGKGKEAVKMTPTKRKGKAALKMTPSKRKKNDDDEEYDPCSSLISSDGKTIERDDKEIAKVV